MFNLYHVIFYTFAFNLFSLNFFQNFPTYFFQAGMGLGFDNGVILAISMDSNSRSQVYIYIGCVLMTVVELVLLAFSDLLMKPHKGYANIQTLVQIFLLFHLLILPVVCQQEVCCFSLY